jgi:hypothetical protein
MVEWSEMNYDYMLDLEERDFRNMAKYHYLTGRINWAKVLGDPVDNYNKDGKEWTFDFTPDEEGRALLEELGLGKKLKNKDDERGIFIQFKQKAHRADGTPNRPITVVDARNRLWDPKIVNGQVTNKIGNNTLGEVKFEVVEYKTTIGVYPQAIRVLDLVPYVRQEFAPLPEDNEFVRKAESFDFNLPTTFDMESAVIEDELDDPLNIEE